MDQKPILKKQLVRSTSAQINLFVDYMAANKDFANGQGEYSGVMGGRKANSQWEDLRDQLREHGADKTVLQWKQTWRDLKRKARKAVKENNGLMPIVSDATFKVLETIGPAGLECNIEIQTPSENHDWQVDSEEYSNFTDNGNDHDKNGHDYDEDSDRSSDPEVVDVKDANSEVEIVVPMPQNKEVFHSGSPNKPQHDPLQAPPTGMLRLPRLAPKPPPLALAAPVPVVFQRPATPPDRPPRPSSAVRRRQIFMSRRRKPPGMFQQASNDFVSLEQKRLRLEEERDRRLHEREMERLKLELQRIEVQRNHNELLQHLVNIAQSAFELLQRKLH